MTTPFTPREIVSELDRFIIGQKNAKKAVAVALRNRWRRQQVPEPLRHEIVPKNILMIGPTGVGKTEIARRLAKLANAPFIKVEATKFTEIGYVGRDVEQIIRDLTENALLQTREDKRREVRAKAEAQTEDRLLLAFVGENATPDTREKFRKMLRDGELEDREIEVEVQDNQNAGMTTFDLPGNMGGMGMINIGDMIGRAMGGRLKVRRLTVTEARKLLIQEESDKLLDPEKVVAAAIQAVEDNGIVFIDEIDKICTRSDRYEGSVSREGVQRDLLPILEGSTVSTKHGPVRTDHILFIASGAFHVAKPADLLPELQGRLPIRVELNPLSKEDFVRILTETESNLTRQYTALLETEGIKLEFTQDGIEEIAHIAEHVNQSVENIGARRLHTILEKLLDDINFSATDQKKGHKEVVDRAYVQKAVAELAQNTDLSKFIL